MLAQIQLESYYVSEISFNYTRESESEFEKKVEFSHQINYLGDLEDSFDLEVILGCSVQDPSGMKLEAVLNGYFKVFIPESFEEEERLKDLCERNTLSILFPYLRSIISDISLKANIDPIILPTINIVALIEAQKEEDNK